MSRTFRLQVGLVVLGVLIVGVAVLAVLQFGQDGARADGSETLGPPSIAIAAGLPLGGS